jgi:diadenosine tetraphosphatase ApaH/serine/threonine PP2A family protein phosphatase
MWRFLMSMKPFRKVGELMFCHDNPSHPGDDKYVRTQEDVEAALRANPETKYFFIGHSHVPRVHYADRSERPEWGRKYPLGERIIINVGSVGQPRDRDPRASYVVLDDEGFRFIRVPYDIEATMEKIRRSPLDPALADRLSKGI